MKSPKTVTQVTASEAATDVPAMPIPPHGGSFVLNEADNTLTHVPLPEPEPEAVEGAVETPVKTAVETPIEEAR